MSIASTFARTPGFLRSFYFYVGVSFLVWMLVFDANDFVKQYDMYAKLQELHAERNYYLNNIEIVKNEN
jgi:hypothetical protein